MDNQRVRRVMVAAALATAAAVPTARAGPQFQQEPTTGTLFADDFSGGFGNWIAGTNTIDHTIFGQTPTLVTHGTAGVGTYARFKLDTYDPTVYQGGVSYLGTQLQTRQTFTLPTTGGTTNGQGVQFEVLSRVEPTGSAGPQGAAGNAAVTTVGGLNAASFSYGYGGGTRGYHDELDFENLTAQQSPPTDANPTGATTHGNAYFGRSNGDATLDTSYHTTAAGTDNNSYYSQAPYAAGDTGTPAGVNIYLWHTYDVDWYPGQVDWYVDGRLVREEAAGETSAANPQLDVPTHPMAYFLNFWAPGDGFSDAYGNVPLAATAAANQEFFYDTADAAVHTLAPLGTPVPEPTAAVAAAALAAAGLSLRRRPGRRPPPA